jgi:ABC-type glycerol-3-phosphate transport system substrate-binding protein
MVPFFSNPYGMLVNNDLFEKEGLSVPSTYQELVEVCDAFLEKGYKNPIMGFTNEETTSLYTLTIYPFFCETVADDAEAVKKLNALDPSAGEYMRPSLEKIEQFMNDCRVDTDACAEIEDKTTRNLYLKEFEVATDAQGNGFSNIMLDYVFKYARKHDCQYITLMAFDDNAFEYWKHQGFKVSPKSTDRLRYLFKKV